MLQSFAKSMNGFSTGERSPEGGQGTWSHSLQSSLWNIRKRGRRRRRRTSHLGGKGDCICWCLVMKVRQQSIYLSSKLRNLGFSSVKFSFQSSDRFFLRWPGVCVEVCCHRTANINTSTCLVHTLLFLLSGHCYLFCWLHSGSLAAQTA